MLLHKPVGYRSAQRRPRPRRAWCSPETRWPDDPSGVRLLERHFHRLRPLVPLDAEASGLMVLTQDGRVRRRLTDDGDEIEQEFVVEVSGEIAPYGLHKLNHGLHYGGRALRPCKVSWQNEFRLRFAIKGVQGGATARHVRAGRPGRGGDPAHPHRQGAAGQDAGRRVALPARRRALLRHARPGSLGGFYRRLLHAAHAQRQSLEEIAQQLIAAKAEILVPGLAKHRAELGLGDREPCIRQDTWCISTSLSSNATRSFFNTTLLVTRCSTGRGGLLSSRPRRCDDQAVEEGAPASPSRQARRSRVRHPFSAERAAPLPLPARNVCIGQMGNLHHLAVAEVEHVADSCEVRRC